MAARRSSRFRSFGWRAALAVALVCALASAGVIAIREGIARETLREWVQEYASEALGVELRIGALEGRLLPELRLRDIELRSGGRVMLSAQQLDLRVNLDPLLSGEPLIVREIALRGLRLQLWREDDGAWNIAALAPAEEAAESDSSLAVLIERLRLEDATVEVDDGDRHERLALAATLEQLALPLDARAARAVSGSVFLTPERQSTAELTLADGRARLAPVSLELAGGQLTLDAWIDLADWLQPGSDAAAHLQCTAVGVDPAALPGSLWPTGAISGQLAVELQRRGDELTSALALDLVSSRLGKLELDRAVARASTRGDAWKLDQLVVEGRELRARAQGGGTGSAVERLELTLAADDLAAIADLVGIPLSGRLEIDTDIAGDIRAPRGRLSARGELLRLGDIALGTLELRARWPSLDAVVVETFALSGGDLPVALVAPAALAFSDGGVGLSQLELRSGPIESLRIDGTLRAGILSGVRILATGLDPGLLAQLAGFELELGGDGSLELELSGPLERPLGEGRFAWRAPHFGEVGFERLDGEITANEDQVALALRGFDAGTATPVFELTANAPWLLDVPLASLPRNRGARLQLSAREQRIGRFARLLPPAVKSATGRVTLDLQVAGGEDGPSVEGRFELSEGSVEVPLARQRFEPIEARLVLRDDRVEVEQLTVGPPGEQASIEGSIGLEGLRLTRSDLRAELERFRIGRGSLLKAKASGALTLAGPMDALVLEGGLVLDGVRVSLPDEQDPELREIQVLAAAAGDDDASEFVERETGPDAFDRATVHIGLRLPPGSRVRGRGAELDLRGDLELAKQPLDAPRLIGEASVVRGHIEFQRKRFDLRRGIVHFDGGPDPSDPVVDIVGVHRLRDVAVILRARGRVSDPPRIELEGEPPMSSDEALAYLVFGRPLDELRNSEQGSVESAAASLAATVALDEFSHLIVQTGIVDTIDVEISEDGRIDSLRVGAYLGSDTYVRAGNTFGSKPEQDVHVEYRLTPYLSVESQLSTSGNAGTDLILRLDY